MKKVYIAGPITNNPDYIQQFKAAEKKLEKEGFIAINPVKEEGRRYKWYIDEGLKQLMRCDAVYMLKGWEKSNGAQLELCYANTVDLEIIFQK